MKYAFALLLLSACASTPVAAPPNITTWIITTAGARHHTATIDQLKAFAELLNYRCYSESDDIAWRDRMALLEVLSGGL